jgi:hypothetical protein
VSALRSFTIAGVRGIRDALTFNLEGRSLTLRGDNGSGKSSVALALRWALMGKPTSRAAEDLAPELVRHRLESDPAAARVTIELKPAGRIELVGGKVTCDQAGQAFRDACQRANPFLRRDDLVHVLDDSPGERFKYFESFLELDRVDEIAKALATRMKARNDEVKLNANEQKRLLEMTTVHVPRAEGEAAPQSSAEVVSAYARWANRAGLALPASVRWEAIVNAGAMRATELQGPEFRERRSLLVNASREAAALTPPDHPATVLRALEAAQRGAKEGDLLPLLEHALSALGAHEERAACPVCEQSIEGASLAVRLRERVACLEDLRLLEQKAERLALDWRGFLDKLEQLERHLPLADGEPAPFFVGRALLRHLASSIDASAPGELAPRTLLRLERLRTELSRAVAALPDDAQAAELRKLGAAVTGAAASVTKLMQIEDDIAREVAAIAKLRAVSRAVDCARKDVATSILQGISAHVQQFYEAIHPQDEGDEPTGAPTIAVTRHASGTARLNGSFNGDKILDPRQLYSDGHLDTVGMCIFLALRRSRADREGPRDPKLMILDDIIMSIDLGHASRLLDVLRDHFKDHQLVILSHNELFMRQCRGSVANARHLTIGRWTLEHGPRLEDHVHGVESFRATLGATNDPVVIASAMCAPLEDFLHAAARAFELSVPTGRALTVSDKWTPLKKKLLECEKEGVLDGIWAVFNRIGDPAFLRNALGAHFNEWAQETPLSLVERVAQGVLDLMDRLWCGTCESIVRPVTARDVSAGLACRCSKKVAKKSPGASQVRS